MPLGIPSSAVARGPRVHLRPPRASDERGLLRVARRSRVLHRPWVSTPTTPSAYATWLEGAAAPNRVRLLLCRNDGGEIAGYFALNEIVRGALQSAYLGYWANAACAGQGLMGEGLRILVRHAFRALRLHRLEANIQPDNAASIGLVRSCGFAREGFSPRYLKVAGRWADHDRWALTIEAWRARPPC